MSWSAEKPAVICINKRSTQRATESAPLLRRACEAPQSQRQQLFSSFVSPASSPDATNCTPWNWPFRRSPLHCARSPQGFDGFLPGRAVLRGGQEAAALEDRAHIGLDLAQDQCAAQLLAHFRQPQGDSETGAGDVVQPAQV